MHRYDCSQARHIVVELTAYTVRSFVAPPSRQQITGSVRLRALSAVLPVGK